MATLDEMIKAIVLAGRDEGFMEPGDNVSATSEVLVIFSGFDQIYDEDQEEEVEDINNEIYDIYINKNAISDDFVYQDREEILDIEISQENELHIRAVYEVDKDYLHMNMIEELIADTDGLNLDDVSRVIESAYENL